MSDQLILPHAFADWKNRIAVTFQYDNIKVESIQGPTPVDVPECPVDPMVTLQCMDNAGEYVGPVYVYDYDVKDWATFNATIHTIPKSNPVDAEVPVPQTESVESPVELSVESTPVSDASPVDDGPELEFPSYREPSPEDDHDEDGEDW